MVTVMRENATHEYLGTLVVIHCHQCAIPFGIPERFQRARREDRETFYCPNGHGAAYRKSEADKLRAELDQMKADRDWQATTAQWARDDADRERRSHSATKGQLTRAKKRAIAGACPCCSRSFVDVRRHMANKHPGEAVRGFGDGKPESP